MTDSIICFHGTNESAARKIYAHGFKGGTYFALHLEQALLFGGAYIFRVQFDKKRFNNVENQGSEWWQFWVKEEISPEKILRLDHYSAIHIKREGWEEPNTTIHLPESDLGFLPTAVKPANYLMRKMAIRAPRGTVPKMVRQVLKRAGESGITANEIVEQAREEGQQIASSSVRGFLRRLEREDQVWKECDLWHLMKTSRVQSK